ncbi:MAG: hypothetical protein ACI9HK_004209, partial [Pirellulaceae bacterium]
MQSPLPFSLTRREMLRKCGMGMGALGMASILQPELQAADNAIASPLAVRPPHFPARAKRVIHIFCNGGPSHLDTFDPKPALNKWHGKEIPIKLRTERPTGAA